MAKSKLSTKKAKHNQVVSVSINAQTYLNNILERLPGSIYWKDLNGVYLGCNNFVARMAGKKSPSEIVGKTDFELPWKIAAKTLQKTDKNIIKTSAPQNLEETTNLADGREITMLTCKAPLYDDKNKIIGVIGTSVDITELKKTQDALKEANRSKMAFVATASHEIRNPISNVISLQNNIKQQLDKLQDVFYSEILDELSKTNKEKISRKITDIFENITEQYGDVCQQARQCLTALENLGELHRAQLHGVTSRRELSDISHLLNEAIEKSSYPNKKDIEVQIDKDELTPEEATLDYSNIRRALSIFIGNAIRFSNHKGRIRLLTKVAQKENQNYLVVTIQDFGVGMSELQLKNLFSPVNSSNKKNIESIYHKPSVQLPLAKLLIETSGGFLEVKSKLKQGTTICITVPYEPSTSENRKRISKKTNKNIVENIGNILLVEDDSTIQKITCEELKILGYQVDCASNGMDAVKMALQNDYSVVLLDISLPDMNGLEVMRKVRSKKQDKSIFVAVTSHASEDDEDLFISEGVMTVLKKPVTRAQFKKAIEAAVKVRTNLNAGR